MAFDAFLKIEKIPGESTDAKHPDWIEISSYNLGVAVPINDKRSSGGGATPSDRAMFSEFVITKSVDKATNVLFKNASTGANIEKITLELCRATGAKTKFLEYTFTKVLISSINVAGPGSDGDGDETVTFNYGTIKSEYTVLDDAGKSKGKVPFGWDLSKNASI